MPLAFSIGQNLEYEYTFLALFSLYGCFILTAFLIPQKNLKNFLSQVKRESGKYFFAIFVGNPLAFLVVPSFLFLSKTCSCSHEHFLKWFVINIYPGFIFSHIFFYVILLGRTKKRKFLIFSPFLLFLVSLLQSLLFFYIFPQKRQTHILFGHLHGPIYDFFLQTDWGIYLARTSHVFLGSALLFLLHKQKRLFQICFCSFLILYIFSFKPPSLQFGVKNLESNFTTKVEKKDFSLFYNEDKQEPDRIKKILKEIIFHSKEIKEIIGLEKSPHVRFFFYDDESQKKLIFGAHETDVTDIFTPSIHLSSKEFPHETLRHELVHALLSEEAPFNLGFHPNMAITEGIAVALAPQEEESSLHMGAAYLIAHGKINGLTDLFSPFFWKYSGAMSYTIAGSLLKYLLDEKGMSYALKIYNNISLEAALGSETNQILKDWSQFIKKYYTPEKDDFISEKRYRYEGILKDKCPHTKAEFLSYGPTLRGKEYLEWRRCLAPEDSYFFIQELKKNIYEAKEKNETSLKKELIKSLTHLKSFEKNKANNYDFYEIQLLKSDLEYFLQNKKESDRLLHELKKSYELLGSYLGRQVLARLELEKTLPTEEIFPWREYLMGLSKRPENKDKKMWITEYLQFISREAYPQSLSSRTSREWIEFFEKNSIPKDLKKMWLRTLALKNFSEEHYIDSSFYWNKLSKLSEGSQKELYKQYERMCHHSE